MKFQAAFSAARRPANRPTVLRTVVVAALLIVVASACEPPPITGAAPLRYRDQVFTSVTKTAGITYGSAVDQQGNTVTLKADVYAPAGDTATARPLVVFVHGGSFCCGDRSSAEILDETNVLSLKGYVTASIDYRLSSPGCTVIDAQCVQAIVDAKVDAQSAISYFRGHAATYGVDPTRIAIAGTSAGAITALNVGYSPDGGSPSHKVSAAVSLSGAALSETPSAGDAPALLFHGTADTTVPFDWAVNTRNAARDAGLKVFYVFWDGDGHVPYVQHRDQILDLTTNFLYKQLNLAAIA